MFQGVKNGWQLIKESVRVFNRHPKFIIPLLITWLVYAPSFRKIDEIYQMNDNIGINKI